MKELDIKSFPIESHKKRNGYVTPENIHYGQLVDVQHFFDGRSNGVACSCKVHFFNKKGVLVGRDYEFIPYEYLSQHTKGLVWSRKYLNRPFERIRNKMYELTCRLVSKLIRITQNSLS